MHPDDARRLGIDDGQQIVVVSVNGALDTTARLDARIRRGVVATPHGFVDANAANLTSGAPGQVDAITGMPYTTGLAVDVRPASRA